jgi:hypothetical protein
LWWGERRRRWWWKRRGWRERRWRKRHRWVWRWREWWDARRRGQWRRRRRRWRGGLENLASDVDHVDSAAQQALALRVLNGLADKLDRIEDDALRGVASDYRKVDGQRRLDWEVRVARIAALRPPRRSGGRSNNHVSVGDRRTVVERKVAQVVLLVLNRRRIKVLGDRRAKDNLSQLPVRRVRHVEIPISVEINDVHRLNVPLRLSNRAKASTRGACPVHRVGTDAA